MVEKLGSSLMFHYFFPCVEFGYDSRQNTVCLCTFNVLTAFLNPTAWALATTISFSFSDNSHVFRGESSRISFRVGTLL